MVYADNQGFPTGDAVRPAPRAAAVREKAPSAKTAQQPGRTLPMIRKIEGCKAFCCCSRGGSGNMNSWNSRSIWKHETSLGCRSLGARQGKTMKQVRHC